MASGDLCSTLVLQEAAVLTQHLCSLLVTRLMFDGPSGPLPSSPLHAGIHGEAGIAFWSLDTQCSQHLLVVALVWTPQPMKVAGVLSWPLPRPSRGTEEVKLLSCDSLWLQGPHWSLSASPPHTAISTLLFACLAGSATGMGNASLRFPGVPGLLWFKCIHPCLPSQLTRGLGWLRDRFLSVALSFDFPTPLPQP